MKRNYLNWLECYELDLHPSKLLQLTEKELNKIMYCEVSKDSMQRFLDRFLVQECSSQKRAVVCIARLIHTSDVFYTYRVENQSVWRTSSNSYLIDTIYKQTLNRLQRKLDTYMNRQSVFDFSSLTVPRYAKSGEVENLRLKLDSLHQTLKANESDIILTQLIIFEIKSSLIRRSITYSKLWYLKGFFEEFENHNPNTTGEVMLFLYEYDFNSTSFTNLLITIFQKVISRQTDLYCQLDIVYLMEDTLRTIVLRNDISGPFSSLSIEKQLFHHVNNKRKLLENRIRLYSEKANCKISEGSVNEKLQVNLSVAKFGLLIRLFIETGVIEEREKGFIFNFFAKHFHTPDTVDISAGSLQRKSGSVEVATAEAIRKILVQAQATIAREFLR